MIYVLPILGRAVLAAASQRTTRIQLGTAVTPLGWENPLRLAGKLGPALGWHPLA